MNPLPRTLKQSERLLRKIVEDRICTRDLVTYSPHNRFMKICFKIRDLVLVQVDNHIKLLIAFRKVRKYTRFHSDKFRLGCLRHAQIGAQINIWTRPQSLTLLSLALMHSIPKK